jgi:hypothetical protein
MGPGSATQPHNPNTPDPDRTPATPRTYREYVIDTFAGLWLDNDMTTTCKHDNLMVSGGVVRCSDCLEWQHNHADSAPRPGLVESNQER